jgi:lysophospholipase L1-like esterase
MKKDWWPDEFRVMMTLGASITAGGWSSSRERCWANLLTSMISDYQRTPVHLINLGIGANVLSRKSAAYDFSAKPAADERLDEHVLAYKANGNPLLPDLLIIIYGLNEARGGTPISVYVEEMARLVARVREKANPLIVLLGLYFMLDFDLGGPEWGHADLAMLHQYNQALQQCAAENGCLFVDLLAAYGDADWLVHHDGVHANDLGHRIIADKIFEVLAQNCSGLAKESRYLETQTIPWRDEAALQIQWAREHGQPG